MLRNLLALALVLLLAAPADAQIARRVGGYVPASTFLGFAANRTRLTNTSVTGNHQIKARTRHTSTAAISSIQFAYCNFQITTGSASEQGNTGAATVITVVEYPSGTFSSPITTGAGSCGGTPCLNLNAVPAAATTQVGCGLTDYFALGFTIPANADFWVRSLYTNSSGIFYANANDVAQYTATFAATNDMNVTAIQSGSVEIGAFPTGTSVTAGTYVVSQTSGTPNGIGHYQISNNLTLTSRAIIATPDLMQVQAATTWVLADLEGVILNSLVPTSSPAYYPPAAIIALTTAPSVISIGDSLTWGQNDAPPDVYGRQGIVCRQIAPTTPCVTVASPGATANQFANVATFAPGRSVLYPFGSILINSTGINDLVAVTTVSAPTVEGYQTTIAGKFPKATRKYLTTITPDAADTAANAWTIPSTQTAGQGANFACASTGTTVGGRVCYNNDLRTSIISGYTGFFDVAPTWEDATFPGTWGITSRGVYTFTDGGATNGSPTVTSTVIAQFTAADIGKTVRINNAGSGGTTPFTAPIFSVASVTSLTAGFSSINLNNAAATVTAGTGTGFIGSSTLDGLHGNPFSYLQMGSSGTIPTASIKYP